LSWEGDELGTAAAEENPALDVEEFAPLPQAETVAPVAGATLVTILWAQPLGPASAKYEAAFGGDAVQAGAPAGRLW
jgi:hypothetical protein